MPKSSFPLSSISRIVMYEFVRWTLPFNSYRSIRLLGRLAWRRHPGASRTLEMEGQHRSKEGRELACPPVPAPTKQPNRRRRTRGQASRAGQTPSAMSRPSWRRRPSAWRGPRHEHGGDRRGRRGRPDDPVRPLQTRAELMDAVLARVIAEAHDRSTRSTSPVTRATRLPARRGELARRRPVAPSSRRRSASCRRAHPPGPRPGTRPHSGMIEHGRHSGAFRADLPLT